MSNPTTPFSWQMPTATDLVTDLPADFEVFGQAVATSMADLLGGPSGYILAKNSATDMDFVWIANDQGDITGITAGTGITVTSPTGPVPTVSIDTAVTVDKTTAQILTNKTLTTPIISSISNTGTLTLPTSTDTLVGRATTDTLTNKTLTSPALTTPTISTATTNGDLLYGTGSGALTRLGIGSSAQVLTVASGVPSWATPAASTPTFVGCFLTKSVNQQINNTTVTNCTFDTEELDTDAFHSTSTNTERITIPAGKAGKYLVVFQLSFSGNATGVRVVSLNKNGTGIGSTNITASNTDQLSVNGQYILSLAVSDYIDISGYQNSGTNFNMLSTGNAPAFCRFAITYLGA